MNRRQTGFTLVEIAIVLVIIGLLLGGILKGQEMIFNSKIKASFNLTREMSAAMNSYLDRYGQLPGDDTQGAVRFPAAAPLPVAGPGVGSIPYADCSGGASATVGCEALYEMRLAGFISGTGLTSAKTPFGAWADIGTGTNFVPSFATLSPTIGFHAAGNLNSGLTVKASSAIDNAFDDGNPATGSWRCSGVAAYALNTPDAVMNGFCAMKL